MQQLLILHGALGSASQFDELKSELTEDYEVHTLDFYGHGENDEAKGFDVNSFADQVTEYIIEHQLHGCQVFGYSMGGYVALIAQSKSPNLFSSIKTLGTKFHWTEEAALKEIRMLQPEIIEDKIPKFASYLNSVHSNNNWKTVMLNTQDLMLTLGKNPILSEVVLSTITIPVHLNWGSKDNMVTQEETERVNLSLPISTFSIIENVPHPINLISINTLVELVKR